jgi:hypothetical protein
VPRIYHAEQMHGSEVQFSKTELQGVKCTLTEIVGLRPASRETPQV